MGKEFFPTFYFNFTSWERHPSLTVFLKYGASVDVHIKLYNIEVSESEESALADIFKFHAFNHYLHLLGILKYRVIYQENHVTSQFLNTLHLSFLQILNHR